MLMTCNASGNLRRKASKTLPRDVILLDRRVRKARLEHQNFWSPRISGTPEFLEHQNS